MLMKKQFQSLTEKGRWLLATLTLIFTLGIGQMWAADADYSSYDWDETEMNKVVCTHGSVVIDGVFKATGNVSSHYYLQLGDNLKYSDNPWKGYMSIASSAGVIDSIKIFYCPNGTNQTSVAWAAWGEGVSPTQKTLGHGVTAGTKSSKTWGNAVWEKIDLTTISAYTVYLSRSIREFQDKDGNTISNFGGAQSINVLGLKVWLHPDCNQPATALSLSSDAPATIYAGTEITFSTSGGNGGSITIAGAASETISANKWTATEGVHTFTASQPKTDGKCAQEAELKLTVLAATPVAAVTVNGPANGYKNNKVIFAATAANATQYRWTVDGVVQGSDSAKLHFTPTESKTYSIVCEAKNTFNSDWIASSAHSLTVTSLYGDLIHFTAKTSGSSINEDLPAANIGGIVGGTVHQKSQSNAKLNSGGYYSLTLASGSFQAGDTVRIVVKPEGDNHSVPATLMLSSLQNNSNPIGSVSGLSAPTTANITADIILTAGAQTIFLSRDGTVSSQNPIVVSMAVIRPMAAKSVAYDLTAVKINGTAISAAELATLKTANAYMVDLMAGYAAAPVVKFARQTTTTYEDDSQKVATDTITVTASEVSSKWQAQATIGTITYTVKAAKQSSAKVYYYDGTTKIGEETVAIGGHPAEYAAKQSKNLATFVGWYSDADLADGHLISDIAAEVITADKTVYGKWTYTYAQSVNIEKWVLDNTKTPNETKTGNLISLLGTRGFASNLSYEEKKVELDSLNDDKGTGRNYNYLGLKVKSGGKMLDFRLAKNSTVKVKFGNVGTTPLYAINGGEYSNMPIEEKVFTYIAMGNDYISIKMADDDAVVFKQIMIDAEIQDVTLPEPTRHAVVLTKAGETEHGTLAVASPEEYIWLAEGAAVTLTVAADEGYYIESVKLNGEALTPSENVYSFAMPNATANVVATFAEIVPNNVTYKANNGGEDADILEENATEIAGCSFTYAGHKFNGWNTAPDGTGDAYEAGDAVLSPLTLYAQWREYFVITYKDGDDVLDTEDVFVGEAPVGIADPVKAMNIFQGWTLAGSDEVIDVTNLNATTTVYAKWEAIDACFYFSAKSVDASTSIAVDEEIDNANGGKVIAKTNNISYETLGVLVASSGSTYMKVELDYAMIEGTKISVKLAAGGTSTRGVNICYDANKDHKAVPMTWNAETAGEVKEFEYTLDSESALNGKKEFFIYRAANTYIQTIKVSNCAPQDYTVTYKDGETTLGTEQVFENEHPTANGINTHKKGYEFQGWAETVDGAVVDLDNITITAAKNLFAQYTVKDCSPKGVKFSMVPQPNELTSDYQLTGTTEQLIGEYAAVTGGVVYLNNNNSSNRVRITKTTSTIQLVSGDDGYIHVELDCPLKENDSIKFDNSERLVLAHNASKTSSVNIAKTDHFYIVPTSWEGKYDFYIWRTGTGCTISGIEVVRPEIYTVSFNMMGHGSAIAPIDVVKGGKVTAPTAPEDDDYAFAGWYKENTLSNEWKFDVDVVTANTALFAKWIDLSDATLKSLKYGAEEITLQAGVYEYNVELPALSTSVPALTAEASNPNAAKEITNATAFDAEGHATSKVVVTPEKVGAATQTYTVNFAKAASVALQDVTGSITWNFANAVTANVSITGTPQVLANYAGVTNDNTFESDKLEASGEKFTAGSNANLRANYIRFHTTVPGKLSISYSNTGGSNPARYIYVNGVKYDEEGSASTTKKGLDTKVFVPAGDVELEMKDGEDVSKNVQIYQMIFNATPDYERPVSNNIGTLCVEHNVPAGQYFGATFYQIASRNELYNDKIDFEEVLPNEELKAGEPYIFQSTTGKIELFFGETEAENPVPVRGMIGNFAASTLAIDENNQHTILYIAQNKLWSCENLVGQNLILNDHRAYIDMTQVPTYANYQASLQEQQNPAPRRRVTLGKDAEQVVTGVENLNASEQPVKLLINGQIFILRGEKMFDATGRLVK